jgi:hypothetical protein
MTVRRLTDPEAARWAARRDLRKHLEHAIRGLATDEQIALARHLDAIVGMKQFGLAAAADQLERLEAAAEAAQ